MNASVIPADIEINERILAKLIDEQFNLRPKSIVFFGEGFDNAVYLVNDQWVFRLPRRSEAIELIATELRILPLLCDRLPLKVPYPVFVGVPSPHFPRPFYGHELIAGSPGSRLTFNRREFEQAACDIANFLRALHALDMSDLGLSTSDFAPVFDRADFAKLKGIFDQRLQAVSAKYDLAQWQAAFEAIVDAAKDYRQSSKLVLVHGDLYHRHLIFDERLCLAGAIDWGDSAMGDAVADLGIAYQFLPRDVRDRFFTSYGQIDEATQNYARFVGLYYAVALLWFGDDRNDRDLIRTSLWTFGEL